MAWNEGDVFEAFGYTFKKLKKEGEVALVKAYGAKGRFVVPKKVKPISSEYIITKIGGGFYLKHYENIESDKRRKPDYHYFLRWNKDDCGERLYHSVFKGINDSYDQIEDDGITSVVLPDTITEIGSNCFRNCRKLESINLPKGITEIPDEAFSGCISLKSIELPNVTSIGECAFWRCTALEEITIPSSVESIENYALCGCTRLKVVNILNDEGELMIAQNAFTDKAEIKYLGKLVNKEDMISQIIRSLLLERPIVTTKTIKKDNAKAIKIKLEKEKVKPVETPASTEPKQDSLIDIDKLIAAAIVDGVITDKERSVILKKAKAAGMDTDEVEILLDAKAFEIQQKNNPAKKGKEDKVEKQQQCSIVEKKPVNTTQSVQDTPTNEENKGTSGGSINLTISPSTTVKELKEEFNKQLGSNIKLYDGRKSAELDAKLSDLNSSISEKTIVCDKSMSIEDFIKKMMKECGLKVKVYTCDEWVAVLGGLSLETSGKIKKNAVKADMEKLL